MSTAIKFALTTATISGFSIFLSKIFVSQMDPVVFTTLKNMFVAIILSMLLFRPKLKNVCMKLTRTDWYKLMAIGVIGGGIPFALFFTGLTMTSAINGAFIHKTLFIWVAFFAMFFLREKLTLLQMAGYVLVLWGSMWVTGFQHIGFNRGEQLIAIATILWALENVIAKRALEGIPFEIVAWGRMFFGSIVLLCIVAFTGNIQSLWTLSMPNLYTTLIGAALLTGYVLSWYKALARAPATLVSSVLTLSTIITAFLSSRFLGTSITVPDLTGFAFTATGVFLIYRYLYKKHKPQASA